MVLTVAITRTDNCNNGIKTDNGNDRTVVVKKLMTMIMTMTLIAIVVIKRQKQLQ